MENWQGDFFKLIDDIAVEVEQFFTDVGETVETFTDEVTEAFEAFSDYLVEDLQNLTCYLEESLFMYFEEYDRDLFEDSELGIDINYYTEEIREDYHNHILDLNPKIEPDLANHPACMNCRHYHGRLYGGNLLVCAMHPYGWDDENCPDWEANQKSR